MGNQLLGMAPNTIHPIEYYLSDAAEFQYSQSLGSTRFLKVAKCKHYEGDCVVKILAIEDPSLPLSAHKSRIERLANDTIKNVSIASFNRVNLYPNFALMARQYVRYSLYDRISTRPFLSQFEKSWILYQCFRCIQWCHSNGITHGDLKLENILVTSSLWIVITDFATYKPVTLPDDNPSDFSYFFDTSRRRCCNIAPERFISDYAPQASSEILNQSSLTSSEPLVTPEMDMFSIGCVTAELFSDDAPNANLFDLGNLLAYRALQYYPEKCINSITNETVRELVKNLIGLEPRERYTASKVLQLLTPEVFPQYFYTLYDYLRHYVRLPPDAKIIRLSKDIDDLLPQILQHEPHGLLLLIVVITSSMRALKHCHCKILAQRLSCKIAASSSVMSPYIMDRLLPYLLHSLSDSDARVRAEAIDSIRFSLEHVTQLPQSDSNLFTDYILPDLCNVVNDRSVLVRIRLASNVSFLARIALNFLSQSCDHNYDEELSLLHEKFQLIVSHLLTDSNNCVRRTLLYTPDSCANLCVFFARQKTNDVILSHIITFLNDKTDFQIRWSFFDNIVVVASFLGSQCSAILQPLLQQGLSDSEETVIYKAIESLSSLIQNALLTKTIVFELVRDALPLLAHPNLWIRHAMVSLILTLTSRFSIADINCKIKPLIDLYLNRKIHSLSNDELLNDSLYDPIPRPIYDLVVTSKLSCDSLFECLSQRSVIRSLPRHHSASTVIEDALYTRLTHEGMNEHIEEQLLRLSEILRKIHRNKKNHHNKKVSGNINITKKNYRRCLSVMLDDGSNEKASYKRQTSTMNEEWLHMFGSTAKLIPAGGGDDDVDISGVIPVAHEARENDNSEMSIHVQCPPCQAEVNKLITHKKNDFTPPIGVKSTISTPFRPKGLLVAHLHEHESSVNRLITIGETPFFVTCSSDGTVKLWDSSRMEGKSAANRSRQSYSASQLDPQPINGITYCGDCIVAYSNFTKPNAKPDENASFVHILEIDRGTSRMKLHTTFKVESEITGTLITDITTVNNNVFAISCSDSTILGYDLRHINSSTIEPSFLKPVWRLTSPGHERLITCITADDVVLFAGTSRGNITTFDLRFLIRSNFMYYPAKNRVRRLMYTPHGLYSTGQGNSEVSLWDCESGSRIKTFWASTAPALSLTQASAHSVLGMLLINTGKDSSMITGGTDMRLRYWDMSTPERSYIISDNGKSSNNSNGIKYTAKFIEGIHVIQECQEPVGNQPQMSTTALQSFDQQTISSSHRDCITDIARINHLLISCSKDGVVKVWK